MNSPEVEPFKLLADRVGRLPARDDGQVPFRSGAIGYLGYGLRHRLEQLPTAGLPDGLPDLWFGIYDRALIYDHRRAVWTASGDWSEGELTALLAASIEGPLPGVPEASVRADFTSAAYRAAIERILGHIHRGDVYQVNMTQRFVVPGPLPAPLLYRRLRRLNPAPFSAYLDLGGGRAVLSSSPERFLELRDGRVASRPIKGTRPRSSDPLVDRALAMELLDSDKDRAELAMIVDLLRNDLGRVSRYGSVRVTRACDLESYTSVHHLVATIEATLREDCGWPELVRAAFPGGSVTGAPKIRAMEIISEAEPIERGVYTGSIGYIDAGGDMDLSVVIRTIVVDGDQAWFQAGGGIVADSDPEAEYRESLDKARALAEVLGARL